MFTIGAESLKGKMGLQDEEDVTQLPSIRLQDPLLHSSFTKGKYTSYKVIIETEHHAFHLRSSCIRRRYSELRWLYNNLHAHHKQIKLPPVPSRKIWSERFDPSFVNKRMKEMEVFINDLIRIDTILSDTALHLFLQTDLTTSEMDGYLEGSVLDDFIARVWANHGHLHTPNELGTYMSIATPRNIEMDDEDNMLAGSVKSTLSTNLDNNNDTTSNLSTSTSSSSSSSSQTKLTSHQNRLPTPNDNNSVWVSHANTNTTPTAFTVNPTQYTLPLIPELTTKSTNSNSKTELDSTTLTTTTTKGFQDSSENDSDDFQEVVDNVIHLSVDNDNDEVVINEENDDDEHDDNSSYHTLGTDNSDSTRESSPALSEGARSSITMSTGSD